MGEDKESHRDLLKQLRELPTHEVNARRFLDGLNEVAGHYPDLVISGSIMSEDFFDAAAGAARAAEEEGNLELADSHWQDADALDRSSAFKTLVGVGIEGDVVDEVRQARGTIDGLALRNRGSRDPETGGIGENPLRRVEFPAPQRPFEPLREDFKRWSSNPFYTFSSAEE